MCAMTFALMALERRGDRLRGEDVAAGRVDAQVDRGPFSWSICGTRSCGQ
jgi:hypothetical protein